MKKVVVKRGFIDNYQEIVFLAEKHKDKFVDYPNHRVAETTRKVQHFDPYRDTEYEEDDRYHVLHAMRMPYELKEAIFKNMHKPNIDISHYYAQIIRYDKGDYVLPHRDSLQQGLYILTDSAYDGLIVQSGDKFVRISDEAGTMIIHDENAWHWVDPVIETVRYTLLTIPPLTNRGYAQ
jgi:hypothetical protein